jgi:hypothetical protein
VLEDLTKGLFASLLLVPAVLSAGKQKDAAPQVLSAQHENRNGAFRFRTPEGWSVDSRGEGPEIVDAQGQDLIVRFVYRQGEAGYDGVHADCMLERLAEAMQIDPQVRYEYDFLSAEQGPHRVLDSAFFLRYDVPVRGHREWRQRNLTIVGGGMSLCVITYCPVPTWKKSSGTRALLEGVVRSVELR